MRRRLCPRKKADARRCPSSDERFTEPQLTNRHGTATNTRGECRRSPTTTRWIPGRRQGGESPVAADLTTLSFDLSLSARNGDGGWEIPRWYEHGERGRGIPLLSTSARESRPVVGTAQRPRRARRRTRAGLLRRRRTGWHAGPAEQWVRAQASAGRETAQWAPPVSDPWGKRGGGTWAAREAFLGGPKWGLPAQVGFFVFFFSVLFYSFYFSNFKFEYGSCYEFHFWVKMYQLKSVQE